MKTGVTPEPNRMIRLTCFDWSKYWVEGMFIQYKGPQKRRGSRFCRLENGVWNSDIKSWRDCDEWEYLADTKVEVNK